MLNKFKSKENQGDKYIDSDKSKCKRNEIIGEKNYNNIKLYKTYIVYKNYRSTEEEK